jgi:hypothetical protein
MLRCNASLQPTYLITALQAPLHAVPKLCEPRHSHRISESAEGASQAVLLLQCYGCSYVACSRLVQHYDAVIELQAFRKKNAAFEHEIMFLCAFKIVKSAPFCSNVCNDHFCL